MNSMNKIKLQKMTKMINVSVEPSFRQSKHLKRNAKNLLIVEMLLLVVLFAFQVTNSNPTANPVNGPGEFQGKLHPLMSASLAEDSATSAQSVQYCTGKDPQQIPQQGNKLSTISEVGGSELDCELLTSRDFEYEQDYDPGISVKGRLKSHHDFWVYMGATNYVQNVVNFGYSIPFIYAPTSVHLKNNASALNNSSFVEIAINDLLQKNLANEHDLPPFVINPLSVSRPDSEKPRLILDLRHVNLFVFKEKHTMEGIQQLWPYILACKNDPWMITFDLKSGYHHIDICDEHQKYLGFAWKFGDKIRYFTFTVLPFGLCSASIIFTKVLREVVKYIRGNGIPLVLWLDDGNSVLDSYSATLKASDFIRQTLGKAGFVYNVPKSHWTPAKVRIWLGFLFDLNKMCMEVTDEKKSQIKAFGSKLVSNDQHLGISARVLASFAGKIVSLSPALGKICLFMTKSMHCQIAASRTWDGSLFLSARSIAEVEFWIKNIDTLSGAYFHSEDKKGEYLAYSDASSVAYGGYIVDCAGMKGHGNWSVEESSKSSTWRELKAVSLLLESFDTVLSGKSVKWHTDSQNVVSIVEKGSMKAELQDIAVDIYSFTVKNDIKLDIQWVPRTENEKADMLSNFYDCDDWGITDQFFDYVNSLFLRTHTVDRFANHYNSKLTRFNSLFWCPGTEGIDAFYQDWSNDVNLLVPPISIVPRVIAFALSMKADVTLIVPSWRSAAYWPLLFDQAGNARPFVQQVHEVAAPGAFRQYKNKRCLLGSRKFCSNILIIKMFEKPLW